MASQKEPSNNKEKKRAAVYVRVSTIGQDAQEQADAQKGESKPSAEEADESFDEGYADLECSGRDLQRPAFQKLVADALSLDREFNAVLVWK